MLPKHKFHIILPMYILVTLLLQVIQKFKLELIEKKQVDMVLRLVAVPSHPVRLWLTERRKL
jgi:hypothetical protein